MSNDNFNSRNGKDRRKGEDRRKGDDRRDSEGDAKSGVLTTRTGERRRQKRRSADKQSAEQVKTKKKV